MQAELRNIWVLEFGVSYIRDFTVVIQEYFYFSH